MLPLLVRMFYNHENLGSFWYLLQSKLRRKRQQRPQEIQKSTDSIANQGKKAFWKKGMLNIYYALTYRMLESAVYIQVTL